MAHQIRFTKRDIEALPPARTGTRDYYEDPRATPGLRLSVTSTGARSWLIQRRIQGRVKRITLGTFPDMTPENARKRAEQLIGSIAMGGDPQKEKQEARIKRLSLAEVFEEFLKVRRSLKPSTIRTYRQVVDTDLKDWKPLPLPSITKTLVAERHALISKRSPTHADSVMRTLRSIWNFAAGQYEDSAGESLLPSNPVDRISQTKAWHRNRPRQTYLKAHELKAWFEAVETLREEPWGTIGKTVGDYLMVLLFTGMRRTETASLPWEQVDLKARTLTLLDTKNRTDHTLPLSDYLLEILAARYANRNEHRYVFGSPGGPGFIQEPRNHMTRVMDASGITFRLHDLRRTFITTAERLELPGTVLSRLANHKLGHPVTMDYIISDIDRLRVPMQKITDYFLSVVGVRPKSTVIEIAHASRK